jgi:uncharacterized membrane protein (TIGR02234 family)
VSQRRAYVGALALLLLGAVVVLGSVGRGWATAQVAGASGASVTVRAQGSDVAGALHALGLLALAGVLAVVATRGHARRALGALLALAGLTVALVAATGDVGAALDRAARTAAGISSAQATDAAANAWRWVCVVGGLLVAASGVLTLLRGGRWPALGARYERGAARTPRPLDAWSALDQGIDPTVDPTPASDPGRMREPGKRGEQA